MSAESVMSAHEGRAIRCIAYTHTGKFVAGSDDSGQVRFFQGNSFVFLNQVQVSGKGGRGRACLPANLLCIRGLRR